jgi:hypothetical protein
VSEFTRNQPTNGKRYLPLFSLRQQQRRWMRGVLLRALQLQGCVAMALGSIAAHLLWRPSAWWLFGAGGLCLWAAYLWHRIWWEIRR